jgi:ankyrin repeat protein
MEKIYLVWLKNSKNICDERRMFKVQKKILFVFTFLIFTILLISSVSASYKFARIINDGNPGMEMDIRRFIEPGKITIFCFYADYEPECSKLIPQLEKLDQNREDVVVYLLNVEPKASVKLQAKQPLMVQYGISSVPSFIVYDPNGREYNGQNAFAAVSKLLSEPPPVKSAPTLFSAIEKNNEPEILILLKRGANINQKDQKSWTPLHHAIYNNNTKIALLLLSKGADPNAATQGAETVVHFATGKGLTEVIRALISRKANLNIQTSVDRATPLHWAVHFNKKDILIALLNGGAKVYLKDKRGMTPLDLAVNEGKGDFAKLIASHSGKKLPNMK